MKSITLALLSCLLTVGVSAGLPSSTGRALAEDVRRAESVTIESISSSHGKTEIIVTDQEWLGKLADTLEDSYYFPKAHCFCIAPMTKLHKSGIQIGQFALHHEDRLRTPQGNYEIRKKTAEAVRALLQEKIALREASAESAAIEQ